MIKGIGVDITELDRMETLIERQPRLKERILTEKEILIFDGLNGRRRIEYFAGRFAAKEAFSKAYGTGIGKYLSFLDIEISADDKGKPVISKPFSNGVHLSISHSRDYAVAQVIIERVD